MSELKKFDVVIKLIKNEETRRKEKNGVWKTLMKKT